MSCGTADLSEHLLDNEDVCVPDSLAGSAPTTLTCRRSHRWPVSVWCSRVDITNLMSSLACTPAVSHPSDLLRLPSSFENERSFEAPDTLPWVGVADGIPSVCRCVEQEQKLPRTKSLYMHFCRTSRRGELPLKIYPRSVRIRTF